MMIFQTGPAGPPGAPEGLARGPRPDQGAGRGRQHRGEPLRVRP